MRQRTRDLQRCGPGTLQLPGHLSAEFCYTGKVKPHSVEAALGRVLLPAAECIVLRVFIYWDKLGKKQNSQELLYNSMAVL